MHTYNRFDSVSVEIVLMLSVCDHVAGRAPEVREDHVAPPEEDGIGESGAPLHGGRGHSRGALAAAAPDAFPPFVGRFTLKEFQVGVQALASDPPNLAKTL